MKVLATVCCLLHLFAVHLAYAESDTSFREVLTLAELDPNDWPAIELGESLDQPTRDLCGQLLFRLDQFSTDQLRGWAKKTTETSAVGELIEVAGVVKRMSKMALATNANADESVSQQLWLCEYETREGRAGGQLLTPHNPSHWHGRQIDGEPVKFLAVVLRSDDQESLLLTNHVGWYPTQDVSAGLLLLAQQGVDVSLLDEVQHRKPFVKPSVSREGEAFYACLEALAETDPVQLSALTLESIQDTADRWGARAVELKESLNHLRKQLPSESDTGKQEQVAEEITATRRQLAMASAVTRQATRNLSSVAPLFLQPELETGQLVRIEGVARRAVRSAAPSSSSLRHLFELEVFPPDSQNLPVVCRVAELPEGFPQGDQIRAGVRVDGIFFKSWRYRTRKNLAADGQTARQQELYTPVVLGRAPIWIVDAPPGFSRWGLWGGLGILLGLAALWVLAIRTSQRDRQLRDQLRTSSPQFQESRLESFDAEHNRQE